MTCLNRYDKRQTLYLPTFPSSEKVPVLTKEGNQERKDVVPSPL